MDIRVIGGGAAALAFGAGGLNYISAEDVLGDLQPADAFTAVELQPYMDSVIVRMDEAWDVFGFETETYAFVGDISFSADARSRTFNEEIVSEDRLSAADRKMVAEGYRAHDYCNTPDVQLFTRNGYNYSVTLRDGANAIIAHERCSADGGGLRPAPSV